LRAPTARYSKWHRPWTCRSCEAVAQMANPNRIAVRIAYRERHKHEIRYHVSNRIADWRKRTPNSDLSVDYLVDLYNAQDGKDYYTEEKMATIFADKSNRPWPDSVSLDRIDPAKGYVQGNVVWCSHLTNTTKGNRTYQEFIDWMNNALQVHNNRDLNSFTL
jgi:hypothetical protein